MKLKNMTPTEAKANFYRLIEEVNESHIPVRIVHKHQSYKNVIILAEEDWRSIQETMSLLSLPGMREKILEGGEVPIKKCVRQLDW